MTTHEATINGLRLASVPRPQGSGGHSSHLLIRGPLVPNIQPINPRGNL